MRRLLLSLLVLVSGSFSGLAHGEGQESKVIKSCKSVFGRYKSKVEGLDPISRVIALSMSEQVALANQIRTNFKDFSEKFSVIAKQFSEEIKTVEMLEEDLNGLAEGEASDLDFLATSLLLEESIATRDKTFNSINRGVENIFKGIGLSLYTIHKNDNFTVEVKIYGQIQNSKITSFYLDREQERFRIPTIDKLFLETSVVFGTEGIKVSPGNELFVTSEYGVIQSLTTFLKKVKLDLVPVYAEMKTQSVMLDRMKAVLNKCQNIVESPADVQSQMEEKLGNAYNTMIENFGVRVEESAKAAAIGSEASTEVVNNEVEQIATMISKDGESNPTPEEERQLVEQAASMLSGESE